MEYLAHTENAAGVTHKLRDHLRSISTLAANFANEMNPALADAARWAGLLHDLGKYREEFQAYLNKERESSIETHHAVYGAALAMQRRCLGIAFVIAGHHAGLHDIARLKELVQDERYNAAEELKKIFPRFAAEVCALDETLAEPTFSQTQAHRAELHIRWLFSALVDADFLDTEAHYNNGASRETFPFSPDELLRLLQAEKDAKPHAGELNAIRNRIYQQCLDAAAQPPGFFSLTVPTGGGKTLSGMAFALRHAQVHELRRVIVVIPYLSIIEQNAAQYRRILDPENKGIVIEHHSAVAVPEDRGERRQRSPLEYAAENWDTPIIVTTSVQFIESLFANKTSRCRKLHNIARSVVFFDEVQTLPAHLLNPLLNILRELHANYGISFVFSTATQPAFQRSASLTEGFAENEITEITRDAKATFEKLRRVRFRLPANGATTDWPTLAEELAASRQALCVVNVRRHAFELWEALRHIVPADERNSVFHLSSAMCAQHRFDLLGDDRTPAVGTIRYRLRAGSPCRLISTQLIEAGVDVDFPFVYRALGPLDSIVQAAGRCNREGRLQDSDGQSMLGETIVFRPVEHNLPRGIYRTATDITAALLARSGAESLATDHTLFAEYFRQLYEFVETDAQDIQRLRAELKFREVASEARVIKDDTKPVIVRYEQGANIVADIRERLPEKGRPRFDKHDLRKLQRYMVNLHSQQFDQLLAHKQLEPLLPNLELYVLAEGFYHPNLGVVINQRPLEDFIL